MLLSQLEDQLPQATLKPKLLVPCLLQRLVSQFLPCTNEAQMKPARDFFLILRDKVLRPSWASEIFFCLRSCPPSRMSLSLLSRICKSVWNPQPNQVLVCCLVLADFLLMNMIQSKPCLAAKENQRKIKMCFHW